MVKSSISIFLLFLCPFLAYAQGVILEEADIHLANGEKLTEKLFYDEVNGTIQLHTSPKKTLTANEIISFELNSEKYFSLPNVDSDLEHRNVMYKVLYENNKCALVTRLNKIIFYHERAFSSQISKYYKLQRDVYVVTANGIFRVLFKKTFKPFSNNNDIEEFEINDESNLFKVSCDFEEIFGLDESRILTDLIKSDNINLKKIIGWKKVLASYGS